MNTRLIISLLCAGALAFACGPRSRSEAPTSVLSTAAPIRAAATSSKLIAHSRKHDAGAKPEVRLDSRLSVDVAPKEVRFALHVTNVGNKHAELNFATGKTYDFVVVDSAGREVWHWSRGRMFTQSVQNKQLGSGDAMHVGESSTLAAGHYTAIATLNSSNYPVEQRSDFVVP